MPVPKVVAACGTALVATIIVATAGFVPVTVAAASDETWSHVRASLFGTRPITEATEALQLSVPKRAEDAAVVPIAIRGASAPGAAAVRKVYLIIDSNPSPVSAVFEVDERVQRIDIETRVRVEDHSPVRAIVERADGSLAMATRYIKASGGCSAPADKRAGDPALLGQMRWHVSEPVVTGEAAAVTLLIRHPNTSGLAMDQVSRLYDPPHFVRRVRVTYRDRLVFSAEADFSLSENPAFRFVFLADGPGALRAEVVDSLERRFDSAVELAPSVR